MKEKLKIFGQKVSAVKNAAVSHAKKLKLPKKVKKSEKLDKKFGFYANITNNRADRKAKRLADEKAFKPKIWWKRILWNLHPKRVFKFWFSKKGLLTSLKIFLVLVIIGAATIFGMFMYFRKDLDQIRPSELAKRVTTTVNKYEDRNGFLLWEDKGDGDYKITVDGDKISTYMRQATVAIEDRDFYSHHGVSFQGLVRAFLNNLKGGATQGGSTLTQQLIKQVYFSDIASERNVETGLPRKIKEMILAIEVERMYDKEQIITLYLNESPYGGRRNGVESGAQTYFGKPASDLNLAEAAILAAIPNNPTIFNPYNEYGHEQLIARQHKVLNDMVIAGFISQDEADAAKIDAIDFKEPVDSNTSDSERHIAIKPVIDQFSDMKAPHFVLEVKSQLEEQLGLKVVRAGGLTIRTTLDYTAQRAAEEAVATGAGLTYLNKSDNIALSSVDVATGQVIAMVGSIGYDVPIYGQQNASTSLLEPGSSIKPVLDYAPLFMQRTGVNYAPGTTLLDENIDNIYCAGNTSGRCGLSNASNKLYGNITIRNALGNSLNIPAVKALIINNSNDRGQYVGDIDNSLDILHKLGDISYCDGIYAGLSSGIGGGCSVRPIEHANAFASLARGGAYRPLAYTLEVKNSVGDILQSWEDSASTQVVDPQVAYMITNILSDPAARSLVFGSQGYSFGFKVPDVWTASKTGTTDNGNGAAKDAWFVSYSPVVATSVWNGNHDGAPLSTSTNDVTRRVVNNYMEAVHKEVYAIGKTGSLGGKWSPNQEIAQPAGIQRLTIAGRTDVYPSWYNQKTSGGEKVDMEFDSVSKKLATEYTPAATRVTVSVTKIVDPVSGKETLYAEDGYDPNSSDDVHTAATSGTLSIPTGLVYSGGFLTATAVDTEYNLVSYSLKSSQGTYLVQDHAFGVSETHTGQISYQLTSSHAGETVTLTVTNEAGYTTSMSTLIPY